MAGQKRDSKSKRHRNMSIASRRMTANQKLVFECIKLASQNKIEELLELFADDVIIYEPFSKKEEGLHGKPAVRSYLNMMTLASDDSLHYNISIEEDSNDKIVALVVFEKGDKITAKFAFEMTPSKDNKNKKIRVVRVEFLDDNHG
jgi:RimJ/RimL family protein N-acetyltransferase